MTDPASGSTVGAPLTDWVPRTSTTRETLDPAPVAALAALLDDGLPSPDAGQALPPLWHWVALPRWPVSSVLGSDGHPRRGDFLPPIGLPRRMFAGGEVTLHGRLQVGADIIRESRVTSVQQKEGRSGPLAIVQVTTWLREPAGGDVLLQERQDLVYRPAAPAPDLAAVPDPSAPAMMTPAGPPLQAEDRGWRFATDPTLLMRFSAATANPHRIHYDWPYATRTEGYPGLVVHGPLSTLVLAEVIRLSAPGRRVLRLHHRNTAPLFCGDPAHVAVDVAAGRDSRDPAADVAEIGLTAGDGTPLAGLSAVLAPDPTKGTTHE